MRDSQTFRRLQSEDKRVKVPCTEYFVLFHLKLCTRLASVHWCVQVILLKALDRLNVFYDQQALLQAKPSPERY
jgi:hypothetical protein